MLENAHAALFCAFYFAVFGVKMLLRGGFISEKVNAILKNGGSILWRGVAAFWDGRCNMLM